MTTEVHGDHFDLLPFIAILMCVLGVLLLVTMSVATISLGVGAGEGWIPAFDGRGPVKIPVLIEWDGKALTVHDGGRRRRIEWGPTAARVQIGDKWYRVSGSDKNGRPVLQEAGQDDSERVFDMLLTELARRKDTHYALFAVRPTGFHLFPRLAAQFRARQIAVGYEPIDGDRPVRLLADTKTEAK